MTRAQHQAKPSGTWPALFNEQRATLTTVAEMLLSSCVASGQVLEQALTSLEGAPLREAAGQICAIRAVVKAAIAYKLKNANCPSDAEAPVTPKHQFPRIPHVGMLPWPERAVYFLREVLHYSRRDTALLLGMSDANIDQLHKFAERRIRHFSNASSQPPDVSGSSQTLDRIAAW
jgi:Sigma-70, region 4